MIVNRADAERIEDVVGSVREVIDHAREPEHVASDGVVPVWAIPEDTFLVAPTMREVMAAIDGTLIKGDEELLSREVLGVVIAGMSMVNVLPRLSESSIVMIPADRTEVLLATHWMACMLGAAISQLSAVQASMAEQADTLDACFQPLLGTSTT